MSRPPGAVSVEELLADARSRLRRVTPAEAHEAVGDGAVLVDIRPGWQRAEQGEVPGALLIERNHLEWRFDPECSAVLACRSAQGAIQRSYAVRSATALR